MKIILGSKSEGRQKVMKKWGWDFDVMSADIDEKTIRHNDPKKLTLLLANAKADALLPGIKKPSVLITSDQVVVYDGKIREKPETKDQARKFLDSYKDHPAETVTSVTVTNTKTRERVEGVDIAKIYFKKIPKEVIERFIKSGVPFHTAGGFRSEDPIISPYIIRIEGERDSVMGLPKKLTKNLLKKLNVIGPTRLSQVRGKTEHLSEL